MPLLIHEKKTLVLYKIPDSEAYLPEPTPTRQHVDDVLSTIVNEMKAEDLILPLPISTKNKNRNTYKINGSDGEVDIWVQGSDYFPTINREDPDKSRLQSLQRAVNEAMREYKLISEKELRIVAWNEDYGPIWRRQYLLCVCLYSRIYNPRESIFFRKYLEAIMENMNQFNTDRTRLI